MILRLECKSKSDLKGRKSEVKANLHQQIKENSEFSFFLAVPTMLAATGYKMLKYHLKIGFNSSDISVLLIGNVVAFVVAIIAIKAFIGFLTKYGFKLFGWYRIIVGAAILILYAMGYQLQII